MAFTVSKNKITFIATLGSEPQVITTTLDLLAQQGITPDKVIVLYTNAPAITSAIQILQQDISAGIYQFLPLIDDFGKNLEDIETPASVRSAFKILYQTIHEEKMLGNAVHLSISGGRKPLSIFGMSAAQMLFDENDHIWYLISSGEFLQSKRLHPHPGDDTALVEIPVLLWRVISPLMSDLKSVDDPFQALDLIRQMQLNEKLADSRSFVLGSLTPGELRVVEALVTTGASDQEIANILCLSPRTVEQHLRSAYAKAADHWQQESVSRAQLVALLQFYFSTKIRENPHDNQIQNH